jgi:hypothetical protein
LEAEMGVAMGRVGRVEPGETLEVRRSRNREVDAG